MIFDVPYGMQDLLLSIVGSINNSPTRDQTQAPALGMRNLATGPPGNPKRLSLGLTIHHLSDSGEV